MRRSNAPPNAARGCFCQANPLSSALTDGFEMEPKFPCKSAETVVPRELLVEIGDVAGKVFGKLGLTDAGRGLVNRWSIQPS